MPPRQTQSQYLDESHQRIVEFSAEFFDDDEEREAFVDTLMERRGYKRTAGWSLPEPTDNGTTGSQQKPKPQYFRR